MGAAPRRALVVLAMAAAGAASAATDLGTLFNTPEERARLDRLRRGEPAAEAASRPLASAVTGFVKRSDGRNTVWIDGLAVPIASPRADRLLETERVREYSDRGDEQLRVERKGKP